MIMKKLLRHICSKPVISKSITCELGTIAENGYKSGTVSFSENGYKLAGITGYALAGTRPQFGRVTQMYADTDSSFYYLIRNAGNNSMSGITLTVTGLFVKDECLDDTGRMI